MARSFTSGSHYLAMAQQWADIDWFHSGADGSIHMWVKLNALADNLTIMAQFGAGGSGSFLMRTSGASPNTKFGVFYGGADLSGREAITSGVFTADVWTPIGCSWDGSTMTAYINGGNTGTASGARHQDVFSPWTVGARTGAGNPFNGDIGEIAMFPGIVLTAAQFAALAKGVPAHEVESRSLRHWKIDGNGTTEPESGAQLRGGREWTRVGTPPKAGAPPVGHTRGGQQRWIIEIEEDGSSLANWTTDSGSWAISGGVIQCSGAGAGGRLRHNTVITDHWLGEWQAEMRISSTSVADLSRGGLLNKWDGSGNGAPACRLLWRTASAERAEVEEDSVAGVAGVNFAFSLDTWYKLTFQDSFYRHDFFVDDVFQCGGIVVPDATWTRAGLCALNAIVDYRNFRYRYLTPTG